MVRRPVIPLRHVVALLLAVCFVLTACSSSDKPSPDSTSTSATENSTTTTPVSPPPALKITSLAKLDRPTAMAQRDGDETLYIAEKIGRVRALRGGAVVPAPVLDISADVNDTGERGLLGLAFAPGKGAFYINYIDKAGDTHITEYALGSDGLADLGTRRELLFVKQPFPNHNGGQLAFGADGLLYIGLGDGGSAGDPMGNAQNLSVLLGKILRINPQPSTPLPYTIPFDNPFAKRAGARGEIWSYGLRNPWTFSFDRINKAMWIADVGQNNWEEINHVPDNPAGGENYGWSLREGNHAFRGEKPTGAIDPVHEYERSDGACSVIGGYVYRGSAIPGLYGRYLFADFCTGRLSALTLRGTAWGVDSLKIKVASINAFGQDGTGELYVLSQEGEVGRIESAG